MIEEASNSNVRVKPKKSNKGKLLIAGGVLLALVIGYTTIVPAVKNWTESELSYAKDRVRMAKVRRGTFERSVAADGKIVAVIKPALFAPDSGRISLSAQPGDTVAKGDVLAVIENQDLQIQLKQAESDLQNMQLEFNRTSIDAKRQIEEAEQELDYQSILLEAAKRNRTRHDEAYRLGLVSLQRYEEVKDEELITKSKYSSLKSKLGFLKQKLDFEAESKKVEIEQKRVVMQDFERQVDELTVRSPINGQIGAVKVNNKDFVQKDLELMSVVDLSAYGVELFVPEAYANDLSLGMEAVVNYESKQYIGSVNAISPEVIGDQIEVRVKFKDGMNEQLKQNQRVAVSIVLQRIEDVVKVERGPFINTNGGRLAYVVKDDIARSVPIKIGAIGVSEVEIVSGLKAGDTVIVSNTAEFNNASSVLLR